MNRLVTRWAIRWLRARGFIVAPREAVHAAIMAVDRIEMTVHRSGHLMGRAYHVARRLRMQTADAVAASHAMTESAVSW